jgi:uracil phosphoribosyltransferase
MPTAASGTLASIAEMTSPVEYCNRLPVEPTVSVCLILDPMLATGGSAGRRSTSQALGSAAIIR